MFTYFYYYKNNDNKKTHLENIFTRLFQNQISEHHVQDFYKCSEFRLIPDPQLLIMIYILIYGFNASSC